jgi:hypothetical protein
MLETVMLVLLMGSIYDIRRWIYLPIIILIFCILLCVTINGITRADNTTKGTDINKQRKFVLQYHIILFSPRHVSTLSSHHQVFYM